MMIMENITTAKLSLDYHQIDEYKQTAYMEKLLFILHYAIIIRRVLFTVMNYVTTYDMYNGE